MSNLHGTPLSYDQATAVYTALVKGAGAREEDRAEFVFHICRGVSEYRFIGSLGHGGKFWPETWRVSCYQEDETSERVAAIRRTNLELSRLKMWVR